MKNFTRLLLVIILVSGWQGLYAQTAISQQTFGTTAGAVTSLSGWSVVGTPSNYTTTSGGTLALTNTHAPASSAYNISGDAASGSMNITDAYNTNNGPATATLQCTGNFSAVGYTGISVAFGYYMTAAYAGNFTMNYRIGSTGGFTQLFTTSIAAGVGATIMTGANGQFNAITPIALPAGANGASEIDFQLVYDRTTSKGNFEFDDLTLLGTPLTPTLTIAPGSLALSTISGGTAQEGTYTISGTNLTGNVTINPPSGVIISTTSGGESITPITLTESGGSIVSQPVTIYVKIANTNSAGAFASANVTNASSGATTQNVAVSGTVYSSPVAFTAGNVVALRALASGASVLDEYTTGGSLVQEIPLFNSTNTFYSGTSKSEADNIGLSLDGQYLVATGYSSSAIDAGTLPANPRLFARIKYDGTFDFTTQINDATGTSGNMRNAVSIDGSGFWLSDNNGSNNPDIYQTYGASSGESFFQGTNLTTLGGTSLTNTRGIALSDGSLYLANGSAIYHVSGVPTSNGVNATTLTGIPATAEAGNPLGFVLFDVDPSIPGPDLMYVADQGSSYAASTTWGPTNTKFGVFKYTYNGSNWVNDGYVVCPATGLSGTIVGNNVVLTVTENPSGTADSVWQITDNGAGNPGTYTSTMTNSTLVMKNVGTLIGYSATGTTFRGAAPAPVQVGSAPTVTNTTGTSASNNMLYLTNANLLYQFSMVNNSATTPAYLKGATFTPSGTYSASNLSAFTLYYNTSGTFDNTAFQIGTATPTASGTAFTFNTGFSLAASATGYFYVCANIANTGNGNTVIINAPIDGNFTFADGGSATGGTYTGGGTNTIVPSQQVYASVSSVSGLYTTAGSSSPWLGFDASGLNLTLGNETLTLAGSSLEMSTDSTTWSSSITLTPGGGVVPSTRIVVRIKNSASAGAVSGTITLASSGANNVVVSVSGYVGKPFTSGNILVSRTGNGSGVLSSSATPVFLDEYTTGGTLVQSIPLPTFENGLNKICTQSGTASTVDLDHLSLDGQYFLSTGFDAPVGMAKLTSTHNSTWSSRPGGVANRVVARIKYDATINTTTYLTDAYDSNLIRSAASIDGSSFYVSGRSNDTYAGADGGARWINLGANTSTSLSTSANVETRNISIISSQLYASTSNAPNIGINAIGTGVSNASGQSYTPLISSLTSSSITPYGYVAFDSDTTTPGVDVIYIADQTNGIYKYAQDAQGVWNSYGQLTGSANGITGKIVGTNVVLYIVSGARGTSGNTVYTITDPVGHANITGNGIALTTTGTLIATAATNTTFGSLDFVPVALGGTPSVAITSPGPAAGGILPGSSHDIVYQLNMTASVANAIVTGITLTTGGTYTSNDLTANAFELWYSTQPSFDTTAVQIGKDAFVASGGNVVFNIAQPIAIGKTAYFYFTVNAKSSPTVGDNIWVTATPTSNVTLADAGIVTGTAVLGGTQTIDACLNSAGVAYAGGGTTNNTNTVICSGTSASIGLHTYLGTIQWQQSPTGGNTTNDWTNVTSGTGATTVTYVTPTLTTTTYYRALVTNSCFEVASNTVTVYVSATPVVTLTNVTPTSVSASWTPFALNSNVKYSLTCTGASSQVFSPVTNNPQTITVTSGSALNVTVAQINPAGCAVSGNASINTQLAAPTLTLSAAAARGFTASWTPVTGATSYTLYYREVGGNGGNSTLTTSSLTATLTGLYGDAIYLVYVVANEAGYTGATSTEQYISTLPGTSTCATPTNIVVSSNCANQISVTMSGSPSNIYRVTFTRLSPNPSAAASYNVTGGAVNITIGVQYANSFWQVLVASNCSGVSSEIANPQYIFIKAACPQLTNLVLSTPTCHGFVATWNGGTCTNTQTNAEDYYLYVQKQGAVSWNAYPVGSNPYITASWVAAGSWNAYVTQLGCNGSSSAASTVQTITTGLGCRTEEEVQADNSSSNDVEQGNAAMNIYPNPTNGNFMVNVYTKNKPDEMVQMEMVNTLGQVVFTVIAPVTNGISNNTFQVPANVASGMYIIRTVAGGENLTKEVMYTK